MKERSKILEREIKTHDNKIGGMLECIGNECDLYYQDNHEVLMEKCKDFETYYMKTKKEFITYASKI
ncbi:hypothetical protein, partial [Aquimarina agarivorans]|uniref:hypothetical protein n=1 Tax=Aquimarina agarivorans TaxID=980584 RepID=UPI000248FAAB